MSHLDCVCVCVRKWLEQHAHTPPLIDVRCLRFDVYAAGQTRITGNARVSVWSPRLLRRRHPGYMFSPWKDKHARMQTLLADGAKHTQAKDLFLKKELCHTRVLTIFYLSCFRNCKRPLLADTFLFIIKVYDWINLSKYVFLDSVFSTCWFILYPFLLYIEIKNVGVYLTSKSSNLL